MKRPPAPGMLLVAIRELRWMRRDRLAWFLAVGVPLIAFAILGWTFSDAVIRDLRVSVVDADRSPTSMLYVQAIGSAPGVTVANRPGDLTAAMHQIRAGEAIAAVYIPGNFERDVLAHKQPQVVVLYNRQYLTPGNNSANSLSAAIAAATASLPAPASAKRGYAPGPLVIEQYVLTNPALNFAQFLLRAVLPTVLHVVTALAGGYAVGSEFSSRSRRAWLRAAGGSPLAALVGKLMPLLALFLVMMVIGAGIVHGLYHIPFRGNAVMIAASAALMLIAYLGLGACLHLLVKNPPLGFSLTGLVCSPAFGFAGVGFPVLGMGAFAHVWGAFLPLRWYIQLLFDQAVRGLPVSQSVMPFIYLSLLAAGFFLLAWWRLAATVHAPKRKTAPSEIPAPRRAAGIGTSMFGEIRRVIGDTGVLGLIVLAPLIYGVLYPQPYLGELLRKLPIAVVDDDDTELSRSLVQNLAADEALDVAVRADTLADARRAIDQHQVYGVVSIPAGTEREVLKGREARIPVYVDSAYFLLFSRTFEGISGAVKATSLEIATRGARADGSLAHAALVARAPVELVPEPLFNPTGSYADYVVPAAFVLILQQTLFIGVATLGGAGFRQGGGGTRMQRAGFRAVAGQALAHLSLSLAGLALYLVVLPRFYGFSTLGHPVDMVLMAVPFVLSVSFMAQFAGAWFSRRESAVLLFIATSLPLFFVVGVSWPVEAVPRALRAASQALPSTSAIDGLVRINQMGASLHDVWRDWATLWALAVAYGLLAIAATLFASRRERIGHAA